MFIKDLVMRRHYNVILENNDITKFYKMTLIYSKNKGKETLNCIVLAKNVKYTITVESALVTTSIKTCFIGRLIFGV